MIAPSSIAFQFVEALTHAQALSDRKPPAMGLICRYFRVAYKKIHDAAADVVLAFA
jgi:hypothetical protein